MSSPLSPGRATGPAFDGDASGRATPAAVFARLSASVHPPNLVIRLYDAVPVAERTVDLCVLVGRQLIDCGEPLMACSVVESALSLLPVDPLREVLALALSRVGSTTRAVDILEALPARHTDMLARCYTDMGLRAYAPGKQAALFRQALGLWQEAFRESNRKYTSAGVHCATLLFLLGDRDAALETAEEVAGAARAQLAGDDTPSCFTSLAVLAQASVILGNPGNAVEYLQRASNVAPSASQRGAVLRQMCLLADHSAVHLHDVQLALQAARDSLPRVLLCCSALAPQWMVPTKNALQRLHAHLAPLLAPNHCAAVYCLPVTIVDVLLLEAARAVGCQTYVVLPVPLELHLEGCGPHLMSPAASALHGAAGGDGGWVARLKACVEAAVRVDVANDLALGYTTANHHYGSLILDGLASIRAHGMGTLVHRVFVQPRLVGSALDTTEGASMTAVGGTTPTDTIRSGAGRARGPQTGVMFMGSEEDEDDRTLSPFSEHPIDRTLHRSALDATLDAIARAAVATHGSRHSSPASPLARAGSRAASATGAALRQDLPRQPASPLLSPRTSKRLRNRTASYDEDNPRRVEPRAAKPPVSPSRRGRGHQRSTTEASLPSSDYTPTPPLPAPAVGLESFAPARTAVWSESPFQPPAAVEQWFAAGSSHMVLGVDTVSHAPAPAAGVQAWRVNTVALQLPPAHLQALVSPLAQSSPQLSAFSELHTTAPLEYTMSGSSDGAASMEVAHVNLSSHRSDDVVASMVAAAADEALEGSPPPSAPASPAVSAFASRPSSPPDAVTAPPQKIMAMLFADVVGYSTLGEAQVFLFVQHVLGAVTMLLDSLPRRQRPVVRNTWGDAVYFVFRRVDDAGLVALMLSDVITSVDWASLGLPAALSMRISLHAAPLHPVFDPVIQQRNYTGVHTSRAARIEPITPPGRVYCSQQFAAIANALGVSRWSCTYVGTMPLAKNYGHQPVYSVDYVAEPPAVVPQLPKKNQ